MIATEQRLCSVEGCDSPLNARGLCKAHYLRAWRAGELGPRETRVCSVEGCGRKHRRNGLCAMHSQRKHPTEPRRTKRPRRAPVDEVTSGAARIIRTPVYDESAFTFTRAEILKARGLRPCPHPRCRQLTPNAGLCDACQALHHE